MMNKYNDAASSRGVAIVQSAGFMSLVSDFLSLSAARDLAKDGKGPPDTIFIDVQKMNGGLTGGASKANIDKDLKDPYILVPQASPAQKIDKKLEGFSEYGWNEMFQKKRYIVRTQG